MNLIQKVKNLAEGAEHIINWLGSGCEVVSPADAQRRANICLKCPHNKADGVVAPAIAKVVKKTLEKKNEMQLRVNGEKSLHTCAQCSCVIRLLVWERQIKIEPYLSTEQRAGLPNYCWKLEKP